MSTHTFKLFLIIGNILAAHTGQYERRFWVGASDLSSEGNFAWLDGTGVSSAYFHPGEPNNAYDGELTSSLLVCNGVARTLKKVMHVKGRQLYQAMIFYNNVPFQNGKFSQRKELAPREGEFFPLRAVP